jgi:Xaa-Pro aminopeptidase
MPELTTSSIRGRSVLLAAAAFLVGGVFTTAVTGTPPLPGAIEAPAMPSDPTPVSREEYAARRAALAGQMGDGVFVLFGAREAEVGIFPSGQSSNFRYLTGIIEPEAALIITKRGAEVEELLFVRPRNPSRELWDGVRIGAEGAQAITGIPSLTSERFLGTLQDLVREHPTLYTLTPMMPDLAGEATLSREQQILRRMIERSDDTKLVSLSEPLQRMRARKSSSELDMIRRAVYVSSLAHREAMRSIAPGMNEFEIHGLVEYFFRRHGADGPAYASIIGSGPNSTTLHYRSSDRFMRDGEVVLLDVGASYQGYAADITRTLPVNGRFSREQREIYEVVLDAQKAAEGAIRPGGRWLEPNAAANRIISEGLARLGLIDSPDATYYCESPSAGYQCPQHRLYYMHSLGHGLGLDVHDPDISVLESFQPGSVFTIEPGIYVRSDVLDHLRDTPENRAMIERLRPAVARYRDIGVRIEDVYSVGIEGLERISANVPREIAEIEAMMGETGVGLQNRRPEVVEWYRSATFY